MEGQYWFVNFSRDREQGDPIKTTLKVWANTLPQAIVRASEEYAQLNRYTRSQADEQMTLAGPWDE